MPKHITRLMLLLVAFGIVAYAAKVFFTADSFFAYGHYRGNSVTEIASDKPKYQGLAACESCHAALYAEWSKGIHNSPDLNKVVRCEVCHGAGGVRNVPGMLDHGAPASDRSKNMKYAALTDTRKLCTLCHEQMPARPAEQRQIVVATHAGTQQCTACHNPHSPRVILGAAAVRLHPGNAAAGKAMSAACAACHGVKGVSANLPGPNLAGQKEAYLVEALKAYKTGFRADPIMGAIAGGLSTADAENLAAYFAGSQCKSAMNGEKELAAAGKALAPKCIACHGSNGISTNPLWPSLAGQPKDYIGNALNAYKRGDRKNDIMAGIAKDLSDADVKNVAAYYANSSCK